jgi:hypothetical protein
VYRVEVKLAQGKSTEAGIDDGGGRAKPDPNGCWNTEEKTGLGIMAMMRSELRNVFFPGGGDAASK